jgi:hypothetical protein
MYQYIHISGTHGELQISRQGDFESNPGCDNCTYKVLAHLQCHSYILFSVESITDLHEEIR